MPDCLEIIIIYYNSHKKTEGFSLIELMVVIAILAILSAIAIPNYITMRAKGYCTEAEIDADHIAAAITDYFGTGNRTQLPVIDDLKVAVLNSVEILGDPNTIIILRVTDRTRRCPMEYQNAHAHWDSNYVFIQEIQ